MKGKSFYNKKDVINTWNGIEVFRIDGKYGLFNPDSDIIVPAIYDSIEWDESSDFIIVKKDGNVGFLSADDGHFIDFNDEEPDDPYMMATPYEEYMKQEWPEWMIKFKEKDI